MYNVCVFFIFEEYSEAFFSWVLTSSIFSVMSISFRFFLLAIENLSIKGSCSVILNLFLFRDSESLANLIAFVNPLIIEPFVSSLNTTKPQPPLKKVRIPQSVVSKEEISLLFWSVKSKEVP